MALKFSPILPRYQVLNSFIGWRGNRFLYHWAPEVGRRKHVAPLTEGGLSFVLCQVEDIEIAKRLVDLLRESIFFKRQELFGMDDSDGFRGDSPYSYLDTPVVTFHDWPTLEDFSHMEADLIP